MSTKRIASYITAYEDRNALLQCIEAISSQTVSIDQIIIIDNSYKPLIDVREYTNLNICFKHFPENIGISGGLGVGIKLALESSFDFLWTFDQDSKPEPDALEKLIYQYDIISSKGNKIGVIGPLPVDMVTGQSWHGIIFDRYRFKESPYAESSEDFYKCDAIITSGSLINLHAAQQVPLPRKDLFIDSVDWDYCMSFKQNGYEIILAKKAILNHRFGNVKEVKSIFKRRKISIYHYSSLRYYYMCRNHTFIETRLSISTKSIVSSISQRIKSLIILSIKILIYEEMRWVKIWACLIGTFDGFRGKLGKTWK
jgi:rhamnosyltransferase